MPKTTDITLDERLFAHIHLDHRLRGSHLQGNTFEATIGYLLQALQKASLSDSEIHLNLHKIKNQFEQLTAYEKEIQKSRKMVEDKYNNFQAKEMCQSLNELQNTCMADTTDKILFDLNNPNGSRSVLIPGGWISAQEGTPGHAMVYQFIKQADDSYHFIVYNTGAGLREYHAADSVIKDKYNPIIAFRIPAPVDQKKLKQCMLDLITPEVAPLLRNIKVENGTYADPYWEKNKIWNAERVYQQFYKMQQTLHAKPFSNPIKAFGPEANFEIVTQGQLSGTCSMRVLIPILRANIAYESYQKFLYQFQFDSILEFYHEQNLSKPNIQKLLLEAIRKLIIKTGKMAHRYKKDGSGLPVFETHELELFLNQLAKIQEETKQHTTYTELVKDKKPTDYLQTEIASSIKNESYQVDIEFYRDDFDDKKFNSYQKSTFLTYNDLDLCSMEDLDNGKKPQPFKIYVDNAPNNKIRYKFKIDGTLYEGIFDIDCDVNIRNAFLYKKYSGRERQPYLDFITIDGSFSDMRDNKIYTAAKKLGHHKLEKYHNARARGFQLRHTHPDICITKTDSDRFKLYYTDESSGNLTSRFIPDFGEHWELVHFLRNQNQSHFKITYDNQKMSHIYQLVYKLVSSYSGIITPTPFISPNAFDESSLELNKKEQPFLLKNRNEFYDSYTYLKDCYLKIKANDELDATEAIITQIEEMFLKFPLKNKKSVFNYWKELSKNESIEAIAYLNYIVRIYGKNCSKLNPYQSAIQTLTANTALVMAYAITTRIFENEAYAKIYDSIFFNELHGYDFFSDIYAVSLDHVFDSRLAEFKQLTNEIYLPTGFSAFHGLHLYDIAFLKRHFPNKEVVATRRWLHSTLQHGNLTSLPITPEQKSEYIVYLQLLDFAKECRFFSINGGRDGASLSQFVKLSTDVNNLESENNQRLCHPSLRIRDTDDSGKPIPPYDIQFPGERGCHTFTTQYEYNTQPDPMRSNKLETIYAIQNPYLNNYLFTTHNEDSNQLVISSQAHFKNKKANGNLSRSLPFARHVKELYAITAKDFFESELGLLNKADYQKFLLVTLFAPNSIEAQLKRNPGFADELKQFLVDALKYHFRDTQLTKGGIFVFELHYFLLKYLKQIGHFNPELLPAIKNTIDWLDGQNEAILEQIQYCRTDAQGDKQVENDLLRIYFLKFSISPSRTNEPEQIQKELTELLLTLLRSKQKNYLLDLDLFRATQHVKNIMQEQLQRLDVTEQKQLIKTVMQEFLSPLIIPLNDYAHCIVTNIDFPIVTLQYQKTIIQVDLSSGKIKTPYGRKALILPEIYNHNKFKDLFHDTIQEGIRLDIGGKTIYRFHDSQGISWRLIYNGYARNEEELSIQFMPPEEQHWFEMVKAPRESPYTEQLEHHYSARLCEQSLWWRECDVKKPKLPSDYVMDPKAGYLLKIERHINGSESCFELDAKTAQQTGYVLLSKTEINNTDLYTVFAKFEDIKHIEIYRGDPRQDPPIKVKLPRCKLEWEVRKNDGTLEYTWKEKPDYKLDLKHPEAIHGFSNMLYMVNKKNNETIAIVARHDFVFQKNRSGWESLFSSSEPMTSEYKSLEYTISDGGTEIHYDTFLVHKDVTSNQLTLTANTPEEYLQLAFLYLANYDADNALRSLRECHKLGIQGTTEEVSLINKIMTDIPKGTHLDAEDVVSNPETLAVKLYAAFILSDQQQKSLMKLQSKQSVDSKNLTQIMQFYNNSFKNVTLKLYQYYCHVQGNVPEHLQLNFNQRLSLLRLIDLKTPALQNEKLFLDFTLAKQEKRYYIKKKRQLEAQAHPLTKADKKSLSDVNTALSVLDNNIQEYNEKMTSLKSENYKMDRISLFNTTFLESLDTEHEFIDIKPTLASFNENSEIFEEKSENKLKAAIEHFRDDITKINNTLTSLPADHNEIKGFLNKQLHRNALETTRGQEKNALVETRNNAYFSFLSAPFQHNLNQFLSHNILDEKHMTAVEEAITTLANNRLLEKPRTFATATQERGGIIEKLQFRDLVFLYLQGDKKLFSDKTRIQDESELDNIILQIHRYLLTSTVNLQNIRILKALKGLEAEENISVDQLKETFFSPIENEEQLIKLGDQLSARREYQVAEHPEILVFEHYENVLLRAEQSDTITSLLEKAGDGYKNKAVQLIMGFGKSKILLPLMALKRADGTNLSMIEIPQSLFGPGFEDLSAKTQRLFDKKGFPLLFDRDADSSMANLKRLHEGLLDAVRNRDYVATTPESICSLELKYLELLSKEEPEEGLILTNDETNQILHLEQILTLIKFRGDVLIDECDTALAHNKELNYTLGQDPSPAPAYVMSHTLRIFDLLNEVTITPLGEPSFTLEDVMLGKNAIAKDKDWELALRDFALVLMTQDNGSIHFVPPENRAAVSHYLLNQSSSVPAYIKQCSSKERSLLDLVKGELGLLRLILSKKPGVDYGFPETENKDFKGSIELAIPYFSNQNPNYRAKKSLYETMMLSIVLQKRKVKKEQTLTPSLIDSFIEDFTNRAYKELSDKAQVEDIQFHETVAAKRFASLTGMLLSKINSDTNRHQKISGIKTAFNYIVQKYILSENKEHNKVARSNRINHVAQFRSASGISGTPWNVKAYHQRFEFDETSSIGIDGVTIAHLKRKNPSVHFINTKDPEQMIIQSVFNNPNLNKIHAYIDIGATFEGQDNFRIATLLKNKFNDLGDTHAIKFILYFDNKKGLCALPVDGSNIIVIGNTDAKLINEKTKSTPAERFTYYDQTHTTGIDIRQTPDTIGITTLDLETNARDCWQGVMRLRQLPNKQTVEFWLPEKVKAGKEWNIDDIIHFVQGNQINKLAEIHLKSAIAKMDNIIREHYLNKIYTSTRNVYEKMDLRKQYAQVFEIIMDPEPSIKFSGIETIEETRTILQNHLEKSCLKKLDSMLIDPDERDTLKHSLDTIMLESLENCLPRSSYIAESEKEIELEVEKEREKEKEKEKEKEQEVEPSEPAIQSIYHKSWRNDFPTDINRDAGYSVKISHITDMLKLDLGFSKNIYVSENFRKSYVEQKNDLDNYVKPLNFFLILKETDNTLKVLCITQVEAKEFLPRLTNEYYLSDFRKKGIEAWITTPHNTLLCGTSQLISDPNNQFPDLLAQLQYLNCDMDRLIRQRNFGWLLQENTLEKLDFLQNTLLPNHHEKEQSFRYFINSINKIIAEKLQQSAHVALDLEAPFLGVKDENAEQGLKTVADYLIALDALKDDNLKKTIVNFTTTREDGKLFTLLDLAIKYNRPVMIQMLKSHQVLSGSHNTARPPILLALEYKRIDLLKNHMIDDISMYPRPNAKLAWELLYDKISECQNSEIIHSFFTMMKTHCDANIIVDIISEKIKRLSLGRFSQKVMTSKIDTLLLLADNQQSFYDTLFDTAREKSNADTLIKLLLILNEKGINSTQLLTTIKRPDILITILNAPQLHIIANNLSTDNWLDLFNYAIGLPKIALLRSLFDRIKLLTDNDLNALLNKTASLPIFSKTADTIFNIRSIYYSFRNDDNNAQDYINLFNDSLFIPLSQEHFWQAIFTNMAKLKEDMNQYIHFRKDMEGHYNTFLSGLVDNYKKAILSNTNSDYYWVRLHDLIGKTLEPDNIGYYYQLTNLNFSHTKTHLIGKLLFNIFVEYSCHHAEKPDIIKILFTNGLQLTYPEMSDHMNLLMSAHPASQIAPWLAQQRLDTGLTYAQTTQAYENSIQNVGEEKPLKAQKEHWTALMDSIITSKNSILLKSLLLKMKSACTQEVLSDILLENIAKIESVDKTQMGRLFEIDTTPEFHALLFAKANTAHDPNLLITLLKMLKEQNHNIHPLLLSIARPDVIIPILNSDDKSLMDSLTADNWVALWLNLLKLNEPLHQEQIQLLTHCDTVTLAKSEFWHQIFDKADSIDDKANPDFNLLLHILTDNYIKYINKAGTDVDYYRDRLLKLLANTSVKNNLDLYDKLANINFDTPKFRKLGNILLNTFVSYSCDHPDELENITKKLFLNGLSVPYQDMEHYINKLSQAQPESFIALWLAQQNVGDKKTYAQAEEEQAREILTNMSDYIFNHKWRQGAKGSLGFFSYSTIKKDDKTEIKVPKSIAKQWIEIKNAPENQTYLQALKNVKSIAIAAANNTKKLRSPETQAYYQLFLPENEGLFKEKFAKSSGETKEFKA